MPSKEHKHTADRIVARLYAEGDFVLEAAANFGGGEDLVTDMSLVRDPDGKPYIPGPSIAGATRSHLARRLLPWAKYIQGFEQWNLALRLFGYDCQVEGKKRPEHTMSPLVVADARMSGENDGVALRDGVRLKREGGVADDTAKFDYEVIESGTTFRFRFECVIRENDPRDDIEKQFNWLLALFQTGEIRLGKRTARGLGRGKVREWEIARLNMDDPKHVLAWLQDDPRGCDTAKVALPASILVPDHRCFFYINACFRLKTSLLIREAGVGNGEADFLHLHSAGKPIIPGGSLSGALSTRAELIARTLWDNDEKAVRSIMEEMFGPVHKGSSGKGDALWRSRVTVEEEFVEGGSLELQERVAIDRFTGGSLDSAKFNEKPLVPETNGALVRMNITLENPRDCEIGLLLLALKDFWLGYAGLGGEASLGRGLLDGQSATLRQYDGEAETDKLKEWVLAAESDDAPLDCVKGDRTLLEKYIVAVQNSAVGEGERPYSRRPLEKETSPPVSEEVQV